MTVVTPVRIALVLAGLAACKDKASPPPAKTVPGDAGPSDGPKWMTEHPPIAVDAAPPPEGEWAACKAALEKAVTAPPTKRVDLILDACHPCGDWKPVLDWQTLQEDGGPNRKTIDAAMGGCTAWCSPNAKVRFMGALDDARANKTRTPWRELAEQCGEGVSARPDGRFVTAPYFALDRVARWAATKPDGAKALEPVVIPLPAVTQTGVGVLLPETAVTRPDLLPVQVTVTTAAITVGAMPVAKLAANGVVPQGEPYPGTAVANKDLAAAVKKFGDKVALFAHPQLPATAVRDLLPYIGAPTFLAVLSSIGPTGWKQHGTSPVQLRVMKPTPGAIVIELDDTGQAAIAEVKKIGADVAKKPVELALDDKATVGGLAQVLGALAYFEVTDVNLVKRKPSK